MGARFYRVQVAYRLAADGVLVPVAPPQVRVPVSGEAPLYRRLAGLVEADDATVCAAASRYGPLGPIGELATLGDERKLGWFLTEGIALVATELDELDRWIAAGGGISVAIPGRLSRTAYLLAAFAQVDPSLVARLLEALTPGSARSAAERAELRELLWREWLRVLPWYTAQGDAIEADRARGDALVRVSAPPGTTVERLRSARRLLQETFRSMADHGGPGSTLEPGTLGGLTALINAYPGLDATPLYLPETVSAWRMASAELALWQEAVHCLRRLGRDSGAASRLDPLLNQLTSTLTQLAAFAGVSRGVAEGLVPPARDSVRAEAASLLTLRLQQVGAWPRPADEVVGAFARALWSLWLPLTGRQPQRRCAWPSGCAVLLPADAHGNRRYCEAHRRQAQRDRAARNRQRRRSADMGAAQTGRALDGR
ncbi:MAG: hypothetical protein ACP5VP_11730 [Candidatus Limnocylindrales bacterium]